MVNYALARVVSSLESLDDLLSRKPFLLRYEDVAKNAEERGGAEDHTGLGGPSVQFISVIEHNSQS